MRHLKEFILQTRWMFNWWHIKVYKGCFSYAWILIINNINTNNRSKSLLFQLSVITHCQTTPQLQPPPTPPSPRLSINPTQVTEKRVEQRSVTAFAPGCLNHLPVRQQKALWHLFNVTPAAEQGAFTVKNLLSAPSAIKKKKEEEVLKLSDRQTVMMALTTCSEHLWVSTCRSQSWVSSQHIWCFLCGVQPTHLSFLSSDRSLL